MQILKPLLKPYKKILESKKIPRKKQYQKRTREDIFEICNCVGSDGEMKDWYEKREIALWVAKRYQKEFGIDLTVYPCEISRGWHLTKR